MVNQRGLFTSTKQYTMLATESGKMGRVSAGGRARLLAEAPRLRLTRPRILPSSFRLSLEQRLCNRKAAFHEDPKPMRHSDFGIVVT